MKNWLLFSFLIIFSMVIYGCAIQEVSDKITQPSKEELKDELKESKNITKEAEETFVLGGCKGEECHQYCQLHQEECKEFCEQNPNECPIDIDIIKKVGRVGPDFCMKNPKECLNLCEKLPGICPEEKQETKLIVANPINLSKTVKISKFRSCAGHDYSGLNVQGEKETLRSMKHYVEVPRELIGSKDTVKIFAPFDGKVVEIQESNGRQIFISANKDPQWHFIFFHIDANPEIQVGTKVKAGELIGRGYMREWPNFDIAFKHFSIKGDIFDSPFLHMQDSILKEYMLRGVTLENIIVPKGVRDNNPCPIKGFRDGEEAFTGETEKEDFVVLK